jgi:hypothetical protein
MRKMALTLVLSLLMLPVISEARCRSIGESASLGTEYGTFPLYPAKQLVRAGEARDNPALMWTGYAIGLPLFVVALPFGIAGAGAGALSHPWTKCIETEEDRIPGVEAGREVAAAER